MKAQAPPVFCASAMTLQGERGLARAFRAVDLDDAAARQAADAERDIEAERAGRHHLGVHGLLALAQAHDRALAEGALDLPGGGIQSLAAIHHIPYRRDAN